MLGDFQYRSTYLESGSDRDEVGDRSLLIATGHSFVRGIAPWTRSSGPLPATSAPIVYLNLLNCVIIRHSFNTPARAVRSESEGAIVAVKLNNLSRNLYSNSTRMLMFSTARWPLTRHIYVESDSSRSSDRDSVRSAPPPPRLRDGGPISRQLARIVAAPNSSNWKLDYVSAT